MHRSRRWKKRPHRESTHQGSPSADQSSGHVKGPRRDLLVFGYASRIFEDEEKARFHDAGRHLIPWMGDSSLLIDRYDCRGHLQDLQQTQTDANRMPDGTPVGSELYGDAAFEELADEERYRDLWNLQFQESERSQAQLEFEMEEDYLAATSTAAFSPKIDTNVASSTTAKFGAVPFLYSDRLSEHLQTTSNNSDFQKDTDTISSELKQPVAPPSAVNEKKADDVEEIPFVPRQNFEVPAHICLPQFERINSIIEKTAQFIAEKGPQLEVVIRTKQANNGSFAFLHPKDMLHPYYNFLVEAMKSGAYKPTPPKEESTKAKSPPPEKVDEEEEEEDSNDGDYLHPSLLRANLEAPKPPPKMAAVFLGATTALYSSLIQTVQAGSSRSLTTGPSQKVMAAIQKIVTYIVKNGESFEELIKKRHGPDDPKFGFVHGYHPYHGLYDGKKRAALAAAVRPSLPPVIVPSRSRSFFQRAKESGGKPNFQFGTMDSERGDLSKVLVEAEPAIAKPHSPSVLPPPPPPPPPPPSSPPVIEEDPRIAQLKKKALEASLRIAERLRERASLVRPEETVDLPKPQAAPPPPEIRSVINLEDSELTQKSSVARKPVQADPGSLLELLQIDRASGNEKRSKEERRLSKEKAKRRPSSSSSRDGRNNSHRKKSHRQSGRKRSRSLSRDRSRRSKKHRRSRS